MKSSVRTPSPSRRARRTSAYSRGSVARASFARISVAAEAATSRPEAIRRMASFNLRGSPADARAKMAEEPGVHIASAARNAAWAMAEGLGPGASRLRGAGPFQYRGISAPTAMSIIPSLDSWSATRERIRSRLGAGKSSILSSITKAGSPFARMVLEYSPRATAAQRPSLTLICEE